MEPVHMIEDESDETEQPIRIADATDSSASAPFTAEQPVQERAIVVRNIKDAKRLMSRLIHLVQIGRITSRQAKDLTYLLTMYVNISRVADIEERLGDVEEKISGINKPAA